MLRSGRPRPWDATEPLRRARRVVVRRCLRCMAVILSMNLLDSLEGGLVCFDGNRAVDGYIAELGLWVIFWIPCVVRGMDI